MRFVVLGAGLMGRAVVYDLARSRGVREIIVADFEAARAREVAREFGGGRARAAQADARDIAGLARLLRGCDVAVNCAQYQLNLQVMRAALRARVHYLDLGGLYWMTRKQLALDGAFRRSGRLALVGMGGAPGITNVMARHLADRLDRVESIGVYNGATVLNPPEDPLAHTFSIVTILDEMSLAPVVYDRGKYREVPLFSGAEMVRFPAPLGRIEMRHSIHSEVGTLARSFRNKGVREVFFKISYDPRLIQTAQTLHSLGLLSRQPVRVGRAEVAPRALLEHALKGKAVSTAEARDVEILRVVVAGRRGGEKVRLTMDATAFYSLRPSFSAVARDTGFPASIAAQMMAQGEIAGAGVRAPEEAVPPFLLFAELEKRRIPLRGPGWAGRGNRTKKKD